jgi:N-glycosylase/DNA lyase
MIMTIPTPRDFSFKRTVMSHGWSSLPPFELDEKNWVLTRVLDVGNQQPVTVRVAAAQRAVTIRADRPLGQRAAQRVQRDVRHILRLDDDLREFYRVVKKDPEFAWIGRVGAGRLLRAPTVFEDLVKLICTTNCSWSLTKIMVAGLVNNLGRQAKDGRRAFPTPAAMAEAPVKFYRDEVRAGYRAPYLKEVAERVASGALDVESWLTSALPTPELKREMKRIKGVGDYAAENLMRLVGRYDGLALDSWVRATFARLRGNGSPATDEQIAACYARFDKWGGLALWCDVTRDWLDEKAQDGKKTEGRKQ